MLWVRWMTGPTQVHNPQISSLHYYYFLPFFIAFTSLNSAINEFSEGTHNKMVLSAGMHNEMGLIFEKIVY